MGLESPASGKAGERKEIGINFWSEKLKGRDFVVDLGVNLRIILKWILKV
jgi:hypothetical protein